MFSSEKERIEFVEDIDPCDRGVEYWMRDVEGMMIASVRHVLLRSIENYITKPKTEWITLHFGQLLLNGSQVHYTTKVEASFKKGPEGVKEYYDRLDCQLLDIVQLFLVKLTDLQSIAIREFIIIDVHAKDVV